MAMNAQIHELGVFVGGSNYIGDVGLTNYISPNKPAIGILWKWNKSSRHSYRFSYTQSKITANDLDSNEPSRYDRKYHFENSIKEVSLGLEFNFFDFDLHNIEKKVSPYVCSGISYFRYDELNLSGTSIVRNNKSSNSFALPIILGVKSNITPNIILALEVGARYTLNDNLDGSKPKMIGLEFGNINNNDWYVFSGLTVTYTFKKRPCYCAK
jgi:opacity protein-like surface antigen